MPGRVGVSGAAACVMMQRSVTLRGKVTGQAVLDGQGSSLLLSISGAVTVQIEGLNFTNARHVRCSSPTATNHTITHPRGPPHRLCVHVCLAWARACYRVRAGSTGSTAHTAVRSSLGMGHS